MKFIIYVLVLILSITIVTSLHKNFKREEGKRGACIGNKCGSEDCGSGAYCQTFDHGKDCKCEAA